MQQSSLEAGELPEFSISMAMVTEQTKFESKTVARLRYCSSRGLPLSQSLNAWSTAQGLMPVWSEVAAADSEKASLGGEDDIHEFTPLFHIGVEVVVVGVYVPGVVCMPSRLPNFR
jgi:hypothetical protein